MSIHAMSSRSDQTSMYVFELSYGFEVVRSDASGVAAQMIDLLVIRDIESEILERETVSLLRSAADSESAVFVAFCGYVPAAPFPALACRRIDASKRVGQVRFATMRVDMFPEPGPVVLVHEIACVIGNRLHNINSFTELVTLPVDANRRGSS